MLRVDRAIRNNYVVTTDDTTKRRARHTVFSLRASVFKSSLVISSRWSGHGQGQEVWNEPRSSMVMIEAVIIHDGQDRNNYTRRWSRSEYFGAICQKSLPGSVRVRVGVGVGVGMSESLSFWYSSNHLSLWYSINHLASSRFTIPEAANGNAIHTHCTTHEYNTISKSFSRWKGRLRVLSLTDERGHMGAIGFSDARTCQHGCVKVSGYQVAC